MKDHMHVHINELKGSMNVLKSNFIGKKEVVEPPKIVVVSTPKLESPKTSAIKKLQRNAAWWM